VNRLLAYAGAAFEALLRNTTRSILTMLGMLIGVAAVTSVYGLSVGATKAIDSSVSTSTFPNLTIVADPHQANPSQAQLRFRDANVLMTSSGGTIASVTPFYSAFASFVNPRRYNIHYKTQK
jgi:putative ABC transport system permease protein